MTLIAAATAVGLAFPGTGLAAGFQQPAPGSIQGVVGQAVQQASQTVQDAGAAASAAQASPVNVAVQIVISSPGASPVIVQTNANAASAKAGNGSSTEQGSQATPAAAGASGAGGRAQGVLQASQAAQSAQAQAKAAQTKPTNVAVQIVKDSPGASPVIVQANANHADAQAANAASTAQAAAAPPPGSGSGPGSGKGLGSAAPPPPASALSSPSPPGALPSASPPTDLGTDLGALLGGVPGLEWLPEVLAPYLAVPRLDVGYPLPGWPSAEPDGALSRDRRDPSAGRLPHDPLPLPATGRDTGGLVPGAPDAFGRLSASSSFVQTPARTQKSSSEQSPWLPAPVLPASAGGGGSPPSAGVLLAALATLALYLSSLGLLFGRLSLASARWRHQAHLAPLQRPG